MNSFMLDSRGNIALFSALAFVPILAAVAGAIDYSATLGKSAEVQNALDAAGLSAAAVYYSGNTPQQRAAYGEQVFRSNLAWDAADGPSFSYSETANGTGASPETPRIEVKSDFTHRGLIGWNFWKPSRITIVSVSPAQPGCLLALHPTAASAIKLTGSTQLVLDNCLVAANSNATNAVSRTGSASLSAKCVTTVGGSSGLSTATRLDCPQPLHGQPATPDPLANIEPPAYTGCQSMPAGPVKLLTPGTYCNQTFSGGVALEPGSYILRGGEIDLGGGGSLTGDGVTIFLVEGAEASFGANQVVRLSAPQSGPYEGITIFQARDNKSPLKLTGNAGSLVTGFVYAPNAHVLYTGNSATTGSGACIRIVARTIELTGNSALALDCAEQIGNRNILAGRYPIIVR